MGWVLLGLCVPITLSANAGTPLMWAGILHLILGNLMIGLLEGQPGLPTFLSLG